MLVVAVSLGVLVSCASPAVQSPNPDSAASAGSTFESGGILNETGRSESLGLPAVVDRVIDGDTILVSVDDQIETVRLLGIDTPEKTGGPRPAECFGAEASARLTDLLPPGTPVLLSRDHDTRDQYSRLLAFVHRADTGMFVNLAMLEEGFATPLFFAPNRSAEPLFTAAGDSARRNWVGFWPACGAADVVLPSSD